jgi:hypothetical protein
MITNLKLNNKDQYHIHHGVPVLVILLSKSHMSLLVENYIFPVYRLEFLRNVNNDAPLNIFHS